MRFVVRVLLKRSGVILGVLDWVGYMRDGRGGMEEMKIRQFVLKTRNQMKDRI